MTCSSRASPRSSSRARLGACALGLALGLAVTLTAPLPLSAQAPSSGAVDSVKGWLVSGGYAEFAGWAAAGPAGERVLRVEIWVGDVRVASAEHPRQRRPDVAAAFKRDDWLDSGWTATGSLRGVPAGNQAVRAIATSSSGATWPLLVNLPAGRLSVGAIEGSPVQAAAMAGLTAAALACLTLAGVLLATPRFDARLRRRGLGPSWVMLASAWAFGACMVALGVSGASLAELESRWTGRPDIQNFLLPSLVLRANDALGISLVPGLIPPDSPLLLATPRAIRSDEWQVASPFILAQHAHSPSFPVLNDLLAGTQNQIVTTGTPVPVWHISALGRPSTWGHFVLGPARGFAWQWWFALIGCFTSLTLLLEIVFRGRWRLGAFVAFCFCSSAFVAAWSLNPALVTAYVAAGGYALLRCGFAPRPWARLAFGSLAGWAGACAALVLYPAHLIPVAALAGVVVAAVLVRDRAAIRPARSTVAALALGAAVVLALAAATALPSLDAISAMVGTVYPGRQTSNGGTQSVIGMFRGLANGLSLYSPAAIPAGTNASEQAGFMHLFPAALAGLVALPAVRRRAGMVAFAVAAYVLFVAAYNLAGLPSWLAALTLFARTHPPRADLGLGLAGLILCGAVLQAARERREGSAARWRAAAAFGIALAMGAAALAVADTYMALTPARTVPPALVAACVAVSAAAGLMLLGRPRAFGVVFGGLLIATSAPFNPATLMTRTVSGLRDMELSRQIRALSEQRPGAWAAYIDPDRFVPMPSLIASINGQPTLNGVRQYPDLAFWRAFDPTGAHSDDYNRYAYIGFSYTPEVHTVAFRGRGDTLSVTVSPLHPELRARGLTHIIATGRQQQLLAGDGRLRTVARSPAGAYTIFALPEGP